MPSNDLKYQEKPTLAQEIAAILGVFLSIFLLICLVGFTAPDLGGSSQPAMWGGKFGFFIARVMMSFLGFTSFLVVSLLFFFSIKFFSPGASLKRIPHIVAGCTGILIACTGLFGAATSSSITIYKHVYPAGGYLGDLLYSIMGKYFGGPGSVLIFFSIFVASLMIAVEFSPYLLWHKIIDLGRRLAAWFAEKQQRLREGKSENSASEPVTNRKSEKSRPPEKPAAADDVEKIIKKPSVHEPVRLTDEVDDDDFEPLPLAEADFRLPGLNLFDKPPQSDFLADREHYYTVSKKLEGKLHDFGVKGHVSGISPGPVITTYEYEPAPGVKINKIVSLADDIALGLKAESVRIVGSIPGKAALGIEIPNPERQTVYIRDILASENFQKAPHPLTLGLGMDVVGNPVTANLSKMPHLLIAGATGAGKSVAVNAIICSILMKATPEDVRLLMVDPKRIELSCYEDIPHLLHPVVVDPKLASRALLWAVKEMERRYSLMEEMRVKSFYTYNEVADERLPLIVIIIDELADLMMVSSRDVEDAVARLAQMARAAGMHLILATQRPSVDVLTGLIKANFPTRMSFKVSSKIDSRTILDTSGAEHLLGAGDMLFLPPGSSRMQRIHGAFISEKEIERVVCFIKEQGTARYDETVLKITEEQAEIDDPNEEYDDKYDEAVALVCETGQASISMVQRRLRVGYNRAARMIEVMEREGVIGPPDGAKPREVLARSLY